MYRIGLTDRNGEWFDADKATLFKENSFHNGRNFISKATGNQFSHEWLYVTAGNKFVLNSFSDYQGVPKTYMLINKEDAAKWFTKQGFSDEEIPEVFHEEVSKTEI
jgi:hypothetical protein